MNKWKYESEWTNEVSMVLTGAAFYHKVRVWAQCEHEAPVGLICLISGAFTGFRKAVLCGTSCKYGSTKNHYQQGKEKPLSRVTWSVVVRCFSGLMFPLHTHS